MLLKSGREGLVTISFCEDITGQREAVLCLAAEAPPVHTLASPTLAHAGWRLGVL